LKNYYPLLQTNGILIQKSVSPFEIATLQHLIQDLKSVGFTECQILNFPQPSLDSGWRTAVMAMKQGVFKRLREKNIFNKTFKTHYYNFDVHQASLVLPEFMRETFHAAIATG
ncbi:MAG TPA: polyamine aminopropyltransferase, partial [Gammaproteobacteria bacterium]|nr:polyamine aminopropyltransferase [Gammaproteobacteria bacterium]